ncbi:MAG: tetratricopeptide repeat protein [Gammaproteobacteria bacterium]|nr:tetratricopeptide repeat protein [Gammaproteobacteria bacterium]
MTVFKFVVPVLLGFGLIFSPNASTDQTDTRLDELFNVLKNSSNSTELEEAESSIWEIWFDSGLPEIDAMMAEAATAVQAGQLKYAEGLYSRVVEQVPGFSEGWNRRATVRYYRQNYEGSLEDIQRTLILEPRHFGATWGLGMILGSRREFTGAIAAFERLLEIKPNAPDARPRLELLKKELAESSV